jgi:hypothetical protein
MKKRNQKLGLHRETVLRLENLGRVVGGLLQQQRDVAGDVTSCGAECGCPSGAQSAC